jgi:transposase
MYPCILDQEDNILLHRNLEASPEAFLEAIEPYREDLVVCAECMHCWYWLADLCHREGIAFVLGHAFYMRAIYGAKVSDDDKDSYRIAKLLRGGLIPMSYVYPQELRSTRDLLRRRMKLVQLRTQMLSHIHTVAAQYNHPPFSGRLSQRSNREELWEDFEDPAVAMSIATDCNLAEAFEEIIAELEFVIQQHARLHDRQMLFLLQSFPGIGKILGLTMLYEIQDISRFPRVGNFASYCRLVKCAHLSDGKKKGMGSPKAGNGYLKWAFSEAAVLILRADARAKKLRDRLARRHGVAKAHSIMAHKIGRAVYFMLRRKEPFDPELFFRAA